MSNETFPAFLYEVFHPSLPRLGPGDDRATQKALQIALSNIPKPSRELNILDLGCGNGAQTLQLARHTESKVLAVDNHQPFIEELKRRAELEGISEKIETSLMDMHALNVDQGSFDLIWSEGALYILGFRNGLEVCLPWLAPNGVMAVTELSWLRPDTPTECRAFFDEEYPDIADIDTCLKVISDTGYRVLDHFILPESAWLLPYYQPLGIRLQELQRRYETDVDKLGMIEMVQKEIDNYSRFSTYYGYVFYIMQRK